MEDFPVVGISAEMTNPLRSHSWNEFKNGRAKVLVATNSCSRALNLNVNLVINYDVPFKHGNQFDPKVYTYRVSRTGRFGEQGVAVTLNSGCDSDIKHVLMRDYTIEVTEI